MSLTGSPLQLDDVSTRATKIGECAECGGTQPCRVPGLAARCALAKVVSPKSSEYRRERNTGHVDHAGVEMNFVLLGLIARRADRLLRAA